MIFIFRDENMGDMYCFDSEENVDKFVKMYGCEYYDSVNVFPIEGEDYTIRTMNVMTPKEAIADYKGK